MEKKKENPVEQAKATTPKKVHVPRVGRDTFNGGGMSYTGAVYVNGREW